MYIHSVETRQTFNDLWFKLCGIIEAETFYLFEIFN